MWTYSKRTILIERLIIPRCGQESLQSLAICRQLTCPTKDRKTDSIGSMSVFPTFQQIFYDSPFLRSSWYKIKSFNAYADNLNRGASHLTWQMILTRKAAEWAPIDFSLCYNSYRINMIIICSKLKLIIAIWTNVWLCFYL